MKTKTVFLLLLVCNVIIGQTKNSFIIGGAMGYKYTDSNSNHTTLNNIQYEENLIQLNPAVGYFITNWFAAGLGIEFIYENTDYDNYTFYYQRQTGYSFAPFIRFSAPFHLFLQGEFDYGNSKTKARGKTIPGPSGYIGAGDTDQSHNIIGYAVGVGYTIKIKEYLGIEPSIKYISAKFNDKKTDVDFTYKGILLNIGLVFFLN